MKIYARVPFVAEGVHFEPNDVVAELNSDLPLGSLASLFARRDLVATEPLSIQPPVEPEPAPEESSEPNQEPEVTDEDLDAELLSVFIAQEPTEWFAGLGVHTVADLKSWVGQGNRLTDAPTIGRVGARDLAATLGL